MSQNLSASEPSGRTPKLNGTHHRSSQVDNQGPNDRVREVIAQGYSTAAAARLAAVFRLLLYRNLKR